MTQRGSFEYTRDIDLIRHIAMIATKVALDVMEEEDPSDERLAYAGSILRNPSVPARSLMAAAVAKHNVDEDSSDTELTHAVEDVFDTMARATHPGAGAMRPEIANLQADLATIREMAEAIDPDSATGFEEMQAQPRARAPRTGWVT